MWALASSLGLVAGAVLFSRRWKRGPSLGVRTGAHTGAGASALHPIEGSVRQDGSVANAGLQLAFTAPPLPERPAGAPPQVPSAPVSSDGLSGSLLEPARRETSLLRQEFARRVKTTDWIMAVSMMVLSLAVAYYAVTSNRHNRSQYQLLASSSKAALAVAEESTRVDQRAWVGFPTPKAYPLNREGMGFAIKLKNFGKTPAVKVLITDYVAIEDLDQLNGMEEGVSNRPMAAGTLMPGSEFDTDIGFSTSSEGVSRLAQGKVRAVNYALITYEDIYHRRHTTRSCFYWHAGLHTPLPCEEFNTVE